MDAPSPIHSTAGRPLVYGHRGASAYARDNTVESIALAVEQGADGVEVDVRATRDGRLILHHDDREPGFEPLGQLDFVQVRRDLPFIPTLDEAWGALGDTAYMNIEVKVDETDSHRGDRLIGDVVDWIAARDVADRVVLSSFDAWTTRQVRKLAPHLLTGQLVTRWAPAEQMIPMVARDGHRAINLPTDAMEQDAAAVVTAAADRGLVVMVWTVDDPATIQRLAEAGVAAVITNDPPTALEALA
jgi:glycerophosphoryl diester phosphodiesterase